MKKNLLLAFAFVMFSAAAMAQSLSIGPEVGVNFNKLNYDVSGIDESSVVGFRAGVTAHLGWGKLALEPGIFYASKGGGTKTAGTSEDEIKLNYLEIPVLLQFRVIKLGPAKIFAGLGPVANFGLSGTNVSTDLTKNPPVETTSDIDFGSDAGSLSGTDFGLMFNVGAQFMGLFVRPYYQMGLSNLSNVSGLSVKNNCFGVSVGYLFGKN
jgi:hypothetical protein